MQSNLQHQQRGEIQSYSAYSREEAAVHVLTVNAQHEVGDQRCGHRLQILPESSGVSYVGLAVEVCRHSNGTLSVRHGGCFLKFRLLEIWRS